MNRISRAHRTGAAALIFAFLLLMGCEDPSGVGLDVIDFGETDPRARTLVAETEFDSFVDATGFQRPQTGGFPERFLAGRAEDPLFGTVEATGYMDFARPLTIPPAFFFVPTQGAFLDLELDYTFGDTTATTTFDVFQIRDNWDPLQFRSDTTLAVEERLLASFVVAAADTLVRVPLAEDWVEEADTLFRADNFEALFHGFQIRPRADGQLVRGFRGTSSLRIISNFDEATEADTVSFFSVGIATGVQRDRQAANPPPELFQLQDGTGEGLYLTFPADSFAVLDHRVLAAGFIRLEADTLLMQQVSPPYFTRPIAPTLAIFGIGADVPVLLAEARLNTAEEAYIFGSSLLTVVLQDMALGRSRFDRLAVGFPRSPSTLNVAPIVSAPNPPRAVLIVVPA